MSERARWRRLRSGDVEARPPSGLGGAITNVGGVAVTRRRLLGAVASTGALSVLVAVGADRATASAEEELDPEPLWVTGLRDPIRGLLAARVIDRYGRIVTEITDLG